MEWIATKHALLAHLPVAAGLLLPLALIAALRPGRGIRPWWTACRYLGWAGLLGLLVSLLSGWANARGLGFLTPGHLVPGAGPAGLRRHMLLAAASLPAAVLTLMAMHRSRKDHQGFGFLPLFLGLVWSAFSLATGWTGNALSAPPPARPVAPAPPPPPAAVPAAPADPEAQAPLRALDFAALEPVAPEFVKSAPHGGRWIRVWASPEAVAPYRTGGPLPDGSLVVMSTVEDRWGRPGPDPGPLYALEMKDGKPRLTFYWARVPEARRTETGGEARAYWRSPDPRLEACLACHASGPADMAARSRWRPRRAAEETAAPKPAPAN